MRSAFLYLFIFFLPVFTWAQINRSAKELAGETIKEYITNKLFVGKSYRPLSFGELKEMHEDNSEIVWCYVHRFELTEKKADADKGKAKVYRFAFYLDKRMKVKRADGSYED